VSYNSTAITPLAQGYVPFTGAKPTEHLWVSPTGNDSNSGSSSAPFKTISAAMAKADPGTAVMVKAGSYTDSIRMKSGTTDKPVWLVSADGEGAAKITGSSPNKPVVYGFGNDNMVIKGLEIIGGMDGIKFTQSGERLVNLVDNVVIQDTVIHGQKVDGIKIAQSNNAVVVGNTIYDTKGNDEGIDIFYTKKGIVAHNQIENIQGLAAIALKAGTENVKVMYNDIADVQRGIVVGGWAGGNGENWPVNVGWQAKNIHVEGNLIQNTSKWAVLTMGAIDSTITKNAFLPNNVYPTVAATGADNYGWHSENIKFIDNIVQKDNWLGDGSKAVTVNTGNVKTGSFDESKVGPDGLGFRASAPAPVSPEWKEGGNIQGTIKGTAEQDTLRGTDKNEYIDGGLSHDIMTGGKGDDIYIVGSMYDKVVEKEGEGVDTVKAWMESYTLPDNVENLFGMKSIDMGLTGNNLSNIIKGGVGNDTLSGGAGADQLWGGGGRDSFVFKSLSDKGDVIMDFKMGQDTVNLRPLLASNQDLDVEVVAKGINAVAVWVHHDDNVEELVTLMGVNSSELSAMQPGKAAWLLV
jgi:Ca2+-binding RTX toxin-like protein